MSAPIHPNTKRACPTALAYVRLRQLRAQRGVHLNVWKHFILAATRAAESCVSGVWEAAGCSLEWLAAWIGCGTVRRIRTAPTHQLNIRQTRSMLLPTARQALDYEVHAVLLGSSTCAIPLNGATLPIPCAEVTPSCLRIQSRGAGWALSTPRVLAGFSNVRIHGLSLHAVTVCMERGVGGCRTQNGKSSCTLSEHRGRHTSKGRPCVR